MSQNPEGDCRKERRRRRRRGKSLSAVQQSVPVAGGDLANLNVPLPAVKRALLPLMKAMIHFSYTTKSAVHLAAEDTSTHTLGTSRDPCAS